MKETAFLVLALIILASTNFAQKPAATPSKKPAVPAKKEIVTTTKKTTATTAKKDSAPTKKNVASPAKKESAPIKKEAATEKIVSPKPATLTKLAAADWKILVDALQAEQWTKADALAADYLKKLAIENDEKQLAQLRYFRLYALAGKILLFHEGKLAVEENAVWATLDKTISEFDGKELVFPPHQFLADCRGSVNFVCPVKDDDHALRVTATNKEGTAIHSFNYVSFDDKIVFDNFDGGKFFLGGKLRRAEFNQDLSKPWLMRLFFDDGFITRADVN